ncbi:hypothetical protein URH17368_1996 [Alicyclobacillus hesperidum URH17-3-68]|nr:hypothetical protein URH17368_1996 [Alicyclobacillus hesperidum URH17-3-68]
MQDVPVGYNTEDERAMGVIVWSRFKRYPLGVATYTYCLMPDFVPKK